MHEKLADTWSRLNVGKCLIQDSYDIVVLLIALHESNQIFDRGDLTGLSVAMKRFGAYLENGWAVRVHRRTRVYPPAGLPAHPAK